MKRITKIITFILVFIFGLVFDINAQSKIISKNELPDNSKLVIESFYNNLKFICIKEGKYLNIEYEVKFENGTSLEFDRKGNIKSIDCGKKDFIDAELIPYEILKFISINYPQLRIIEYSIEYKNTRYETHEIELHNGLELVFSGRYKNKY